MGILLCHALIISHCNILSFFFLQTTKCDSVFQIILSSMEFESKIAMRGVSNDLVVGMLITWNEKKSAG